MSRAADITHPAHGDPCWCFWLGLLEGLAAAYAAGQHPGELEYSRAMHALRRRPDWPEARRAA